MKDKWLLLEEVKQIRLALSRIAANPTPDNLDGLDFLADRLEGVANEIAPNTAVIAMPNFQVTPAQVQTSDPYIRAHELYGENRPML